MPDRRDYPTAINGTWSDLERRARYLFDTADEQSDEYDLAEAVLVLLRTRTPTGETAA